MDRKTFLSTFSTLSAGFLAGMPAAANSLAQESSFSNDAEQVITILHTNDTHSRIKPFPESAGELAGLGGYARRAALIKQIRSQQPNLLLLDAGDIFQGTPYFNFYKGKLELQLMSKMGYDAAAIGNHEFDNGVNGFADVAPNANFPFLCSNYYVRNTPMEPFVENFMIKEFGEIKIGIFGLGIAFENLILDKLHEGVTYRDAKALAVAMVRSLRTYQQCDYLICLSHLGYKYEDDRVSDWKIANEVDGIDLIIGGHTHTFLDEPVRVKKTDQPDTLITQVGWGGVILGRLDLHFASDKSLKKAVAANTTVNGVRAVSLDKT